MHLEQEVSIRESQTAYGTVAVVDMVGYSTLARMLEENTGTGTVADLNRQIQEFVQSALRHLDDPAACTKIAETGDGAILLFETAHDAHLFAEQLHLSTEEHNRNRSDASAKRWFRIGVSTGELNREKLLLEREKYAGITIANAVRLETAAEAGEIVVDIETFGILPKGDRGSYGPQTVVRGKRDEVFTARRYKVVNSIHSHEPEVTSLSKTKVFRLTAAASAFVVAVLTALLTNSAYVDRMLHFFSFSSAVPILKSVQIKPNLVRVGDTLTITAEIDRPAPKNGVTVSLSSSDPSVLTVDGSATIYRGETSGTAYSRVVAVPGYLSPIAIVATYNGEPVRSLVSVTGQRIVTASPSPRGEGASSPRPGHNDRRSIRPSESQPLSTSTSQSLPVPLNPELISRYENAKAYLSAQVSYWEIVRKQMPAGTSLRPEITSQIFAAESAGRRCDLAEKQSDAASLSSCVDALNDHLTQLKIQH